MSEIVGRRRQWGKTCAACGINKPLTEFYTFPPQAHRTRTQRICKTCEKARVKSYRRAKKNSKRVGVSATAIAPVVTDAGDDKQGLSDLRIRQLAEWYTDGGYWHYSPAGIAAGALDAELRAILHRELPDRVEVEFARVRRIVRRE
jgi:hypothetical protein